MRGGARAVVAVALLAGVLVAVGPTRLRQRRQDMLVHAAAMGQMPIMRALLAIGADPAANSSGGFPLYAAAWHGNVAAIELLIARGAPVDARETSGATALMGAAAQGHDDAVRALLARRASVTASCGAGNALDAAAANGHSATAAILVAAGAKPRPTSAEAPE